MWFVGQDYQEGFKSQNKGRLKMFGLLTKIIKAWKVNLLLTILNIVFLVISIFICNNILSTYKSVGAEVSYIKKDLWNYAYQSYDSVRYVAESGKLQMLYDYLGLSVKYTPESCKIIKLKKE